MSLERPGESQLALQDSKRQRTDVVPVANPGSLAVVPRGLSPRTPHGIRLNAGVTAYMDRILSQQEECLRTLASRRAESQTRERVLESAVISVV